MDFLAGYGSSSDDEETKPVVKASPAPSKAVSTESSSKPIDDAEAEDQEDIIEYLEPVKQGEENVNNIVFRNTTEKKSEDQFSNFSIQSRKRERDEPKNNGQQKKRAVVPIQLKSISREDDEPLDDDLKSARSRRPLPTSTTLGFLPAPKNNPSQSIKSKPQSAPKMGNANNRNNTKGALPALSDDFFGEDEDAQPEKATQKIASKPRPNMIRPANLDALFENDEPSFTPSTTTSVPSYPRDVYEEPAYEQYQQYVPPQNLPKEFAGAAKGSMIEVNVAESLEQYRQEKSRAKPAAEANNIPEALRMSDEDMERWAPSKNHRRQGHASFLIWDLKNKLPELEAKRAESARNRKEARQKYGW
ncbi:hypothetical protein PROFUN_06258 [Planoprotostelium fungivorum]|uniref:Mitotic checkpoint regulator, MAD2B-interacting-domain-containing protein n=1 Tax=Planoprotostelium fungivorum TaxID=1890364 RepID=A0A2P6NE60_9EUKA|nr:hypothetical protein PROFUN_06258 [Planoprotostelium fungivorum]